MHHILQDHELARLLLSSLQPRSELVGKWNFLIFIYYLKAFMLSLYLPYLVYWVSMQSMFCTCTTPSLVSGSDRDQGCKHPCFSFSFFSLLFFNAIWIEWVHSPWRSLILCHHNEAVAISVQVRPVYTPPCTSAHKCIHVHYTHNEQQSFESSFISLITLNHCHMQRVWVWVVEAKSRFALIYTL